MGGSIVFLFFDQDISEPEPTPPVPPVVVPTVGFNCLIKTKSASYLTFTKLVNVNSAFIPACTVCWIQQNYRLVP